ncbi:ClpP/crotonase-like domain-containing protein, partial [Thamnocephalis sphaerospora]
RTFVLNRPEAYNALNLGMVRTMTPQLQAWEQSDLCKVIMLKSDHPKAFCAGGDVKNVISLAKKKDPTALSFFEEEYQLNHLIATLRTPFVAIMNGITMGGGVGLSVHAPFRVATEKTMLAMPETAIGLFPDVGGTFFLPRLDGETGTYLALTGDRLSGEDVLYSGIATHFVPSHRLPALEERLNELESDDLTVVNMAIEEFSAEPTKHRYSLGPHRDAIDRCFKYNSVEEILAALKKEKSEWADKTLETLNAMSPTSLRVTLRQLRIGRELGILRSFQLEYSLVQKFLSTPDFYEGVTAKLVENRAPQWSPATLAELPESKVEEEYFQTPAPNSLSLLNGVDYKLSPHRKFMLPTEQDVRQAVMGERASSGSVRPNKAEVISALTKEWNSRTFVRERVEEIVERCCRPDAEGYLNWTAA